MKKTTAFIFLFFILSQLSAQSNRWSVSGTIQDKSGRALPSATITLLDPKDSTLVTFGVSNPTGSFEIKNIRESELVLQVSFVGFKVFSQVIKKPENSTSLSLALIKLDENTAELDMVTVEDIAPVTVKKDTIEYNAMAFKTQPNSNVEDLLKRLPGVEVDSEGNIKAQGEKVQRIFVDGKEFFGNDPKMASKNLLAEAISKIQIYDRKSDQAAFTGIDDGKREKTINLQLKEDYKKGYFGTLNGGAGTENRYALKGNVNKFSDKQQLSFLGMANNTNEQGFSIDDYINFNGGIQSFASGGQVRIVIGGNNPSSIPINTGQRMNGIMNSIGFGSNINQELSKKTKMNGSYFFNRLDHNIIQNTNRLNFFPTGDFNFNERSKQDNLNSNHKVNLILDHKIDTLNSFRSTTNANYTETNRVMNSLTENTDLNGNILNKGERTNLTEGNSFQLNTDFLFRHRFKKQGRSWSANLNLGVSDNQYQGDLYAKNEFFTGVPETEIIEQLQLQENTAINYGGNFSYTEPLGGRKYLEVVYNFRQNHNDVNREVFDKEEENLEFNTALSNKFTSLYTYHRPGVNFSMNRNKYNVVAGLAMQATRLNGELLLFDEKIKNRFENILPSLRVNYSFSNSKNLGFDYGTSVTEPTIEQLQPVINNSDPLNIYVGNPELKPAFLHNWRVNYNSFDMGKFISFFGMVNVNYTENAIVNSQSIDERQVRTIMPVNVKDNLMLNSNVNLGFPIKQLNSSFSVGPNLTYQKGLNLINEMEDVIKISNLGGNIRYDYNWKEYVNVGLSANLSRQRTAYDFSPEQNQLFFNQNYNAEANINFLKNYTVGGNFNYLLYKSETTDFRESIPVLNLSISRFILKGQKGEIKLTGQNLFNQNVGVSQRADVNFIEQTVTNNLGRFILLSFTYKLNNNLNPMNNMPRPGGGGVRMIRMGN
ncbi:TonB-dependent receptor family protein [Cognataquiflexum aquatile]|uniref:TonB-dependent receptor family protein n=1 Tax=Cognataquiflexum aquatile TaxID=2249427 RepID=UPI000DE8C546|nr:TonB-dependent receptor family protein [Cognataquiflexum aquatile]